jgi:tRNA (cmo5U34)-methyltransferase
MTPSSPTPRSGVPRRRRGARVADTGGVGHHFHRGAETYLELTRAEVPDYDRLQEETAEATRPIEARAILELGTGTGETARRLLALHPLAELVGVDSSEQMLAAAGGLLDPDRVDLRVDRIEYPLPPGPFDLVVAALVVHHLEADDQVKLFQRVHSMLRPGGRFVVADVVVPEHREDAITPPSPDHGHRSTLGEQLEWLEAAGLSAAVIWTRRDLAVIAADRRT